MFSKHAEFRNKLLSDSARAAVGSHGQFQGLGYHSVSIMYVMKNGRLYDGNTLAEQGHASYRDPTRIGGTWGRRV